MSRLSYEQIEITHPIGTRRLKNRGQVLTIGEPPGFFGLMN